MLPQHWNGYAQIINCEMLTPIDMRCRRPTLHSYKNDCNDHWPVKPWLNLGEVYDKREYLVDGTPTNSHSYVDLKRHVSVQTIFLQIHNLSPSNLTTKIQPTAYDLIEDLGCPGMGFLG